MFHVLYTTFRSKETVNVPCASDMGNGKSLNVSVFGKPTGKTNNSSLLVFYIDPPCVTHKLSQNALSSAISVRKFCICEEKKRIGSVFKILGRGK